MKSVYKSCARSVAYRWVLIALAGALICTPQRLQAQAPTRRGPAGQRTLPRPGLRPGTEQSKFKGIFEPVNYNQDLRLTDVFFLTAEEGWVSGQHGTILHTSDGGRTWVPQLGGDPQSQEPEINHLSFLDRTHGWAVQAGDPAKLLRTVDGENWELAGALPKGWGLLGYQFVSPSAGVVLDGNNNVSHIFRTLDGGRTWKEVFPPERCRLNTQVQGLNRQLSCTLWTLNMVSATVGYILGRVAYEKPELLVVAKTTDGGASWSLTAVQGPGTMFDYNGSQWMSAFFIDEHNGVLATSGDRLYATSDGGQSWRGLTGTAPGPVQFADPEVGWSFGVNKLSYTTDGGGRWSSRQFAFPAYAYGFGLARRDRAYVVGDHGMIYRYSAAPADYSATNAIDAPLMPGVGSPELLAKAESIRSEIQALQTKLSRAASGANSASAVTAVSDAPAETTQTQLAAGASPTHSPQGTATTQDASGSTSQGAFTQDTSLPPMDNTPPSSPLQSCCGNELQVLQTDVGVFTQQAPAVSSRFRTLNLIFIGLQIVSDALNKAHGLRDSFRTLKHAPNLQAASAALQDLTSRFNSMAQTFTMGLQNPGSFSFAGTTTFHGAPGSAATAGTAAGQTFSPAESQQPSRDTERWAAAEQSDCKSSGPSQHA